MCMHACMNTSNHVPHALAMCLRTSTCARVVRSSEAVASSTATRAVQDWAQEASASSDLALQYIRQNLRISGSMQGAQDWAQEASQSQTWLCHTISGRMQDVADARPRRPYLSACRCSARARFTSSMGTMRPPPLITLPAAWNSPNTNTLWCSRFRY